MANNTVLNAVTGTAGDTITDVDIGTFTAYPTTGKVPAICIYVGPNTSAAPTPLSTSNPLPVTGTVAISGTVAVASTGGSVEITNDVGNPIPVSGTITANAGTNLNTSALALEAGGHLAAIDGKVPALGQALAAASVPVVLTAAQLTTLTPVGTVAATQAAAASLNATVVGTGTFATQAAQSGTWNIGTVTTVTTVAAVTAITNPLPAGTNLLGQVSASHETGTLYSGTTALTPKFAVITASASGATTVVAAVGGKRIRVLRWSLSSNGAVNAKWQSHVTPTDLTGLHYLTQFASAGGAYCPVGIFQTISGEALDINLSAAVAVGGELTYVEV